MISMDNDSLFRLNNKTILVTGASSGIGKSICIAIAKMGANVILTGRNELRLNEVFTIISEVSLGVHSIKMLNLEEIDNFEDFISTLPKIDGIVHCAGIAKYAPYKFLKAQDLSEINRINYEAPVLLTQGLLKNKKFNKMASIIFIASISSLIGTIGSAIYSGSKGAIISSTKALALECASQAIRANCISPGIIITSLTNEIQKLVSEEDFKKKESLHPLGFGKTEDVANAVVFLLSDASRWITGTNLIIDGGYTAQ